MEMIDNLCGIDKSVVLLYSSGCGEVEIGERLGIGVEEVRVILDRNEGIIKSVLLSGSKELDDFSRYEYLREKGYRWMEEVLDSGDDMMKYNVVKLLCQLGIMGIRKRV